MKWLDMSQYFQLLSRDCGSYELMIRSYYFALHFDVGANSLDLDCPGAPMVWVSIRECSSVSLSDNIWMVRGSRPGLSGPVWASNHLAMEALIK